MSKAQMAELIAKAKAGDKRGGEPGTQGSGEVTWGMAEDAVEEEEAAPADWREYVAKAGAPWLLPRPTCIGPDPPAGLSRRAAS